LGLGRTPQLHKQRVGGAHRQGERALRVAAAKAEGALHGRRAAFPLEDHHRLLRRVGRRSRSSAVIKLVLQFNQEEKLEGRRALGGARKGLKVVGGAQVANCRGQRALLHQEWGCMSELDHAA